MMEHSIDREKVIKGLRICFMQKDCDGCPYQKELKAILDKPHNDDWHCPILDDALALLKEQEKQKFFVDENGKITPLPVVVRCKDCEYVCMCNSTDLFPDMPVYAKCTLTDEVNEPDWFCADGKRKD